MVRSFFDKLCWFVCVCMCMWLTVCERACIDGCLCVGERRNSLRYGCYAPPVEVLKKHLLGPQVGGQETTFFPALGPNPPSLWSEAGHLCGGFQHRGYIQYIQHVLLHCVTNKARVRTQGHRLFFQHQFPQRNVQRTVFSKRHILHYWGFSYHFIYICIFVPCDLFFNSIHSR